MSNRHFGRCQALFLACCLSAFFQFPQALASDPALSVGNLVFHDQNGNGRFDALDSGIDGVTVMLVRDANYNGSPDPDELSAAATVVTSGGGSYQFTEIEPGNYWILIPQSEFGPGKPLHKLATVEPTGYPADGIDNDDNGYQWGAGGVLCNGFTVASGQFPVSEDGDPNTNLTIDFGFREVKSLTLGNLVFRDNNKNGRFDAGDAGVDGVVVHLLSDANKNGWMDPEEMSPVRTTTTSGGGLYSFTDLEPGTYSVEVAMSNMAPGHALSGLVSSEPTGEAYNAVDNDDNGYPNGPPLGVSSGVVSLEYGLAPQSEDSDPNTNLTIDFGFRPAEPLTVGNLVFRDNNDNGRFDAGDEGVDGVEVQLLHDANGNRGLDPDEITPIRTVVTSNGGWYSFSGLEAGLYWVNIGVSNFLPGGPLENHASLEPTGDPNTPIDNDDNGYTQFPWGVLVGLDLNYGLEPVNDDGDPNTDLTIDFGFRRVQPITVGDLVFRDANKNGRYDSGEEGIDGVIVRLVYDANENGSPDPEEVAAALETVTSDGGHYTFSGLSSGNAWILIPSENMNPNQPLENMVVTTTPLDANNGADNDNNGSQWGLDILSTRFDLQLGLQPASEDGDPNTDLTIDIGFRPVQSLTVGNLIFLDANRNGRFDGPDSGIDGVTVQLVFDANQNGNADPEELAAAISVVTSQGGFYSFDHLARGNYFIYIPALNFLPGGALEGLAGTFPWETQADNWVDNDNNGHPWGSLGVITDRFDMNYGLQPTIEDDDPNTDLTIDLGFRTVGTLTIGDRVFLDANGNGRFDNVDSGIDGVTVQLIRDSNGNNGPDLNELAVAVSTVTHDGGKYTFSDLAPGLYWVNIAAENFAPGHPLQNLVSIEPTFDANNGVDNDDNGWAGGPPWGVLGGGIQLDLGLEPVLDDGDPNTNLTLDFGFRVGLPVAVGNQVFRDNNANGIFDTGDDGIDGVAVQLIADADNNGSPDPNEFAAPVSTTVTSGGGFYQFSPVLPGYYWVYLPGGNFAPGAPLEHHFPTQPSWDPSNGVDYDNNGYGWGDGIICNRFDVGYGIQPIWDDGDNNTDLTIDFGLRAAPQLSPVVSDPADLTVAEHQSASFAVGVQGTPPFTFQWYRNGSEIPGANGAIFTIPIVSLAEDGAQFSVTVENALDSASSAAATLTVQPDTASPTLLSAFGLPNRTRVLLVFSEPLDATSAENPLHYTIDGGLSISAAKLRADQRSVFLTTSLQDPGAAYVVTVNDLADLSTPPHIISPGSQASFTAVHLQNGVLSFEAFVNTPSWPGGNFIFADTFPDEPDFFTTVAAFNSRLAYPNDQHENYGGRMWGWIIPQESGDYNFFIQSDDQGELRLSPDDDPSHAVLIAHEDSCCGPFEEPGAPETSAPISLAAGRRYYVEALWREGVSGDYARVAWRKTTDPTPANLLEPIPGAVLQGYAGAEPSQNLLSIGNLVFLDKNSNGVFDAEDTGIEGVQVNLYRDQNLNFNLDLNEYTPIATTTTDSNGSYRFDSLTPGGYWVGLDPSNFGPGKALENRISTEPTDYDGNNGIDNNDNGNNAGPVLGVISPFIPLDPGFEPVTEDGDPDTDLTIDFGFRAVQSLTIGNLVFNDANHNGRFDSGESGLSGVVVNLLRDADNDNNLSPAEFTPVATTVTGEDGTYSFAGVTPGGYWVEIAASNFGPGQSLANFVSTEPTDYESNNGIDNNDNGWQWGGGLGVVCNRFEISYGGAPVIDDNDPNTNLTIDFGFRAAESLTIGNQVFLDNNNNRKFEPELGETGIDGVTVNLYRDANLDGFDAGDVAAPVASTTTSGGGIYKFSNLSFGSYYVEIPQVNFAANHPLHNLVSSQGALAGDVNDLQDDDDNGLPSSTGVVSAQFWAQRGFEPISDDGDPNTKLTIDFGFVPAQPMTIGNQVFLDNNANGRFDADDIGIDEVVIKLIRDANENGGIEQGELEAAISTVTSGGGFYSFVDVPQGNYWVWIPRENFDAGGHLNGLGISEPTFDSNNGIDNDNNGWQWGADGIICNRFDMAPGLQPSTEDSDPNTDLTIDFAFRTRLPLTVGDLVFFDNNANGRFDGNDVGIPGVLLHLLRDANSNYGLDPGEETSIATTTTDASGHYRFAGMPDGRYRVQVDPVNFAPGGPLEGRASSEPTGDANSAIDNDDNGFAYGPALGVLSSATDLLAGLETRSEDGSGDTDLTIDFSFRAVQSLTIGDLVFRDNNSNGRFDTGDQGIAGVTVQLLMDANQDGSLDPGEQTPIASTTTDSGGLYSFGHLIPGYYWVLIPQSSFAPGQPLYGLLSSEPTVGDSNSPVDNVDRGFQWGPTGVLAGRFNLFEGIEPTNEDGDPNTRLTVDFGFRPAQPLSIGDFVFRDDNGDAIFNGNDSGIPGVTVRLLRDANLNWSLDSEEQIPVAVTTTDGGGRYSFQDIAPGRYWVDVTSSNFEPGGPLAGMASSYGAYGSVDNADTGVPGAPPVGALSGTYDVDYGTQPIFDDGDGNTQFTADFGFTASHSITVGNRIWIDTNQNGRVDPGEPGIDGVTVSLIRDSNENYSADPEELDAAINTISFGGGFYLFENIAPGYYWVLITPENFESGNALEGMSPTPITDYNTDDGIDDDNNGSLGGGLGVVCNRFNVFYGLQPINDDGDPNTDFTIDFGFLPPPPLVVRFATTLGTANLVEVVFSRTVSADTATDPGNYSIDNGVVINSVAPGLSPDRVILTTSGLNEGTSYTVTVNNVQDLLTPPQTVPPGSQAVIQRTQGVLTRRVFYNIPGNDLGQLLASPKFPDSPDETTYVDLFETPSNAADNYGVQLAGYLHPPVTGDYIFYMSSDDNGILFLSTDESPANKVQIASEPQWNPARAWVSTERRNPDAPENRSAPIHLESGRMYYIEALAKDGGGGDDLGVTWQLPGAPAPTDGDPPISGAFLSSLQTPGPVSLSMDLSGQTATELLSATFAVSVQGTPPYFLQWFRNDVAIPGATGSSYTLNPVTMADHGAIFYVRIANHFSVIDSAHVALTVLPDQTPPVVVSASADETFQRVTLQFSEPVTPDTANIAANYTISGGPGVLAASLLADGRTVDLTTSPLAPGRRYLAFAANISDRAATPNFSVAGAGTPFTAWVIARGFALHKYFDSINGGINTLLSDPRFPNHPTYVNSVSEFEWPPAAGNEAGNHYGNEISALFVAPVTGMYRFYIASDDPSVLFLSSDFNPANKIAIASEPSWNLPRYFIGTDNRNPDAPENVSALIPLSAGNRYYIQALHTEGEGGDNVAVAVQIPGGPAVENGGPPISGQYLESFVNPDTQAVQPFLFSLEPTSASVGGPSFDLVINGSAFVEGAVVLWNGSARATTFVDVNTLKATINAADLQSATLFSTATVTVQNPAFTGGLESTSELFTITGSLVEVADTAAAAPGAGSSVSTAPEAPGEAGVSASVNNTGGDPIVVTAATYTENPAGGTVFDAGAFVDLQVSGADSSDTLTAGFYYPDNITGTLEANLVLLYYNTAASAWQNVLSSGDAIPAKDTTDNLDSTISGGRFTVTFDNTSTPAITELDGTVFTLTVLDIFPPEITALTATPSVLSPQNHKLVAVTLQVSARDNSDPSPRCEIVSVISNEPDEGLGDGDKPGDIEITGPLTLNLRAERSGKGTGRIYTITVRCTDALGNSAVRSVMVTVPHDAQPQKPPRF